MAKFTLTKVIGQSETKLNNMKNYSEIYVSLREEIIQQIDCAVDHILEKYDVESISQLENAPVFQVYITEYIDDGLGNSEPALNKITIEEIFVGGIAFTVRLTNLAGGESVTVQPSHYTSQSSRVVMVLTYDTEV